MYMRSGYKTSLVMRHTCLWYLQHCQILLQRVRIRGTSQYRKVSSAGKCLDKILRTDSRRFGDGVYSYRNPALADIFATSCTTSPFRVMIVADVLVEVAEKAGKLAKAPTSVGPVLLNMGGS
jgi:hypothetical protein